MSSKITPLFHLSILLFVAQSVLLPITTSHAFSGPKTTTSPLPSSFSSTILFDGKRSSDRADRFQPLFDGEEEDPNEVVGVFDPLHLSREDPYLPSSGVMFDREPLDRRIGGSGGRVGTAAMATSAIMLVQAQSVNAAEDLSMGAFDPNKFKPICPASGRFSP